MTSRASPSRTLPARPLRGVPRAALAGLTAAFAWLLAATALADEAAPAPGAPAPGALSRPAPEDRAELERRFGSYVHVFGTAEIGKGLRFNNPYRLATQLGDKPESLSLTASYLDLGAAFTLGEAHGLEHGAALHLTFSLAGVPQQVLTPTYVLGFRPSARMFAYGRVGPSIILSPDPTLGAEVDGGFAYFVTSRVAVAGELCFDLYYGAGNPERGVIAYPILSGQLGLLVDYEVLP